MSTRQCAVCERPHSALAPCRPADLAHLLSFYKSSNDRLKESNKVIPSLMEANSEAVKLANDFRRLAAATSKALNLMEEVTKEHGESGAAMWADFQKKLEEKWDEYSSQSSSQAIPDTESTTPQEIESRLSIAGTTGGETTAKSLLL